MNDHGVLILGVDPGTLIMGFALVQVQAQKAIPLVVDVVKMKQNATPNQKLKAIMERTQQIVDTYHPHVLAIESPFCGKNPQTMLKLGRAQGVVIATCLHHGLEVFEYSPRRIKQSITGNGAASKEQVAAMLHQMYRFENTTPYLDATDALAVAVCHHLQSKLLIPTSKKSNWEAFLLQHKDRIIDNQHRQL